MPKVVKHILATILAIVLLAVAVLGIYVIYLEANYSRIADNTAAEVTATTSTPDTVNVGQAYTAVTYNIGFGAYTPDYTFFMDEGYLADGTKTVGEHSRAVSEESELACTNGDISLVSTVDEDGSAPDFILFQEVDTDSDRSYHVNQRSLITAAFPDYTTYFAYNFHSAYLAYPFNEPIGSINSGLLTLSTLRAKTATRRSYPIDESFPTKFFDLDRCFVVMRYPTSDGHELVLVNSHMSAYDKGGTVRARQLNMVCSFISSEYAKGNYVIVGGDFNHALCGSIDLYPSQQLTPDWVAELDDSELPDGFSVVQADNLADVATCRGDDIPYEKGVTYTTTIDGFIVSDNVTATATNIDNDFEYSDHNPVRLSFSLGTNG